MTLSGRGEGGVRNGGSFTGGAYNGSNPSLFGDFVWPAFFTMRADNLLRVGIFHYACCYADTAMT